MENNLSRDIGEEIIAKLKEIIAKLEKRQNEEKLSNPHICRNRA